MTSGACVDKIYSRWRIHLYAFFIKWPSLVHAAVVFHIDSRCDGTLPLEVIGWAKFYSYGICRGLSFGAWINVRLQKLFLPACRSCRVLSPQLRIDWQGKVKLGFFTLGLMTFGLFRPKYDQLSPVPFRRNRSKTSWTTPPASWTWWGRRSRGSRLASSRPCATSRSRRTSWSPTRLKSLSCKRRCKIWSPSTSLSPRPNWGSSQTWPSLRFVLEHFF